MSDLLVKDIHEIISNQAIQSGFTLLILAGLGYLTVRLNSLKAKSEIELEGSKELLKSTKRVGIRNEYLSIYNSHYFNYKQKYEMTRELISEYIELNGNSYVHELDVKLKKLSEEKPDEIE